jgi:small subunit ribosomal protein S15
MTILSAVQKAKIVKDHGRSGSDTGSVEVQVALLTESIKLLTDHCNVNRKDFHSRRGLLNQVRRRTRLLKYLNRIDAGRYIALIQSLNIRDSLAAKQ